MFTTEQNSESAKGKKLLSPQNIGRWEADEQERFMVAMDCFDASTTNDGWELCEP
jgi:hypothetical protein